MPAPFDQHSHLQAIVTRYHGPTNTRGARVSAKADAGRLMAGWNHELDVAENHRAAAMALAKKMDWLAHGEVLVGGGMPDGRGSVFAVLTREDARRAWVASGVES